MRSRTARPEDIDFFLAQEARAEFQNFIFSSSREQHQQYMNSQDCQYFIFQNDEIEAAIGYAILSGLTSLHGNICLVRIVMAKPGQGYGKQALRLLLDWVFTEYKAHRFWLDVFEDNHRARHVYQSVGFREEGLLREVVKQQDKYASQVVMSILEQEYFQQLSEKI
ncbi:GNAT family N-acetyltransferase [Chroococcidiopsis sp. FACHB-1243]|uniref:GNAT family N-acetyltransferase n=1 Tax=Chroococcidiopsis sp. [FACHB-1243] TaxID=2692781 RepID=UPI00177AA3ED|nr:GNAT family protein [Chroococcidiopsis sp. [FACHB-1243]]MBD2303948.1 GNAT family N-acetyltransferase [Chroococcidiopsis sp. [FACHB-1243]]